MFDFSAREKSPLEIIVGGGGVALAHEASLFLCHFFQVAEVAPSGLLRH